jgi:3-oxoacyl-[acyl-carrier-protein] synthase-3
MSKIIGVGSYLPGHPISNTELAKRVSGVDSEWIETRTGILQRYFAPSDEFTSHMAIKAAEAALLDANISPNELDIIIVATTTSDRTFPAVATQIQSLLGITKHIPSFDLQAVCAGFVYGLETAQNFLNSGKYNRALLIGADKMSSILDFSSRNCSVLFGDGAGAIVIEKSNDASNILASKIYADGTHTGILYTSDERFIQMEGKEVFRHAIEKMSSSIEEILLEAGVSMDEVDFLIPHQANIRIIDGIATKLGFPDHKIVKTVSKHANCSAASIPLALDDLKQSGKLQRGNIIVMTALGAGLTWGSAVLRW